MVDYYTKFKNEFKSKVKPIHANVETVELLEDRLLEFSVSELAFKRLDEMFEFLEEVADVGYYNNAIEMANEFYHYSYAFGENNDYYKEVLDRLLAEKEACEKGLDLFVFAKEYIERLENEE